ncbi:MAG: hypothetical protein ABSA97_05475 [Verrucomicrobiia bacterium]
MDYAIPIGILIIVATIILVAIGKIKRRREHRALLFASARQFVADVQQRKALFPVESNVLLKSGETAFYSSPSALYETRAVRHYQSGFTGFRVAKGVYVGGSRGRSVSSQEWSEIGNGWLTITNKRLIFDGGGASRNIALGKIVSIKSSLKGLEVSIEGRSKSVGFEAANGMITAAILNICCQAENPLDLSQTKLNFTFEE